MKKSSRRFLFATSFAAILPLAGWFLTENVLPYSIIKPWRFERFGQPEALGLPFENVAVKSAEGFDLKGWLIFPKDKDSARATIIFCHGIGGNRTHFISMSQKLAERGVRSLLLDGRAMGASGGEFCTFGYFEKEDERRAVDWLEARFPGQKIGIWGASLGGAVALQSLANDPRLDFGLVESTFTRLSDIISDYQKRRFLGLRLHWVSDRALEKAGEIARFDPETVVPAESAKQISQPVFLAHGTADKQISPNYGQQIFQNLSSADKQMEWVEGAGHNNLHAVGGQVLDDKMLDFVARQIQK